MNQELEDDIKSIVEGCDVMLYDISMLKENSMNIFRIYITSQNGINLDKCAQISRLVSPYLDVNEPMYGKYNLEVSSPGIERKLKTLNHFKCSIGHCVKIKEVSTKITSGKIKLVNKGVVTIAIENEESIEIKFDDIKSASTVLEWKK